jgi:hypothetical protein
MNALGAPPDASGCTQSHWVDDVIFFNIGSAPATVMLLDATYPFSAASINIAAGRSTTFRDALGTTADPDIATRLGVLHLDVPKSVLITHRMFLYASQISPLPRECPLFTPPYYAALPLSVATLPVKRSLIPANQRQVHPVADLGGIESRMSAVIYNAGVVSAQASIELRRGCNETAIDSRRITIPARTAVQVLGFTTTDDRICPQGAASGLRRSLTVTVDQPSLSWVTMTQQFPNGAPVLGASQE